jgi:tRNA threonylcarbamoyladenosine biosynthesis protein TsaE
MKFATLTETQEGAKKLGNQLRSGDVIALIGPLGVGKTAFTSGLAQGLNVSSEYRVTSPTFVYAQTYPGRIPLHHIDLYRVESEEHLARTGIEEMIGGGGVAVIEWFDLFPSLWPGDRLEIRMAFGTEQERTMDLASYGPRSAELLRSWK